MTLSTSWNNPYYIEYLVAVTKQSQIRCTLVTMKSNNQGKLNWEMSGVTSWHYSTLSPQVRSAEFSNNPFGDQTAEFRNSWEKFFSLADVLKNLFPTESPRTAGKSELSEWSLKCTNWKCLCTNVSFPTCGGLQWDKWNIFTCRLGIPIVLISSYLQYNGLIRKVVLQKELHYFKQITPT